jgi:hypothetical protein
MTTKNETAEKLKWDWGIVIRLYNVGMTMTDISRALRPDLREDKGRMAIYRKFKSMNIERRSRSWVSYQAQKKRRERLNERESA